MNTIDKILIADVAVLLAFTITMIIIYCIFQSVPDTLIECFFSVCGGEGVLTFAIWWIKKKSKNSKHKSEKENET